MLYVEDSMSIKGFLSRTGFIGIMFLASLAALLLSFPSYAEPSSGSISGRVLDEDGSPIPGERVGVIAYFGDQEFAACSDPSTGQWVIWSLPLDVEIIVAGGFDFWRDCGPSNYLVEYWQNSASPAGATRITLTSVTPNVAGIDFRLARGAMITGTVRDSAGDPILGKNIGLLLQPGTTYQIPVDPNYRSACSDPATGEYSYRQLAPGSYVIAAGFFFDGCPDPTTLYDSALEYWLESSDPNDADPITITSAGQTVSNVDFTLGTFTSSGVGINVEAAAGVSITFAEVLSVGVTEVDTTESGPEPPSGFQLGDPPTYYELTTTATLAGDVEVCIDYSGVSFADENELKLYHFEGNVWVNATTSIDTTNDIICATVTSLSPFAIFEGPWVGIDIKPGREPNSINPQSKGTVPVAILSTVDFDAPARVNRSSVRFGRTGQELSLRSCDRRGQDVNGDGLADLVCHFKTRATGLQTGDTVGVLTGMTKDGSPIIGWDSVRIVSS